MKSILLLLNLILISSTCLLAQEKTKIFLKGKAFRPIDTLILLKTNEDARYQGINIPINADSTFNQDIEVEYVEEYQLIFKSELLEGMYKPIVFFSDGEIISFELYPPDEFDRNVIKGSKLSGEKKKFNKKLFATFSKEMNHWFEKLYTTNQDSLLKIKAQSKIDSLNRQVFLWQHDYFSKQPNILGYYEYFNSLKRADRMNLKSNDLKEVHKFWFTKFPDHPLSEAAENLMSSIIDIKVGGKYIDFVLYKVDSSEIKFSYVIKENEYTLLDLWAPWCAPCIRKSKKLKENFKTLQEQNINVVGVIGGIPDYTNFENARKKYDYPWKVYPEINNENRIWEKYKLSNSGGSQFLIDKNGKFIAINPSINSILSITEREE